jgi:hypothetical protein
MENPTRIPDVADGVDAATFDRISDRVFEWHNTHFSRGWEYPWVVRHLDLHARAHVLDTGAGRTPRPFFSAERGALTYTYELCPLTAHEQVGGLVLTKASPSSS